MEQPGGLGCPHLDAARALLQEVELALEQLGVRPRAHAHQHHVRLYLLTALQHRVRHLRTAAMWVLAFHPAFHFNLLNGRGEKTAIITPWKGLRGGLNRPQAPLVSQPFSTCTGVYPQCHPSEWLLQMCHRRTSMCGGSPR